MKARDDWFVEQRGVALAVLFLSRRSDLLITEYGENDYGVDLLVNISRDGEFTGRMFGVVIKASRFLQAKPLNGNGEFGVDVATRSFWQDLPLPLCLFALSMENDEGYYRWLLAPTIGLDGEPRLTINQGGVFRKITREELDKLVEQVNRWYDKRSASLSRSGMAIEVSH